MLLSLRRDDYDGPNNYTSQQEDAVSNYGSENYAPPQRMFKGTDGKGTHRALLEQEALVGGRSRKDR